MSTDNEGRKRFLRAEMKRLRAADAFRDRRDGLIAEQFFRLPFVEKGESFFIYRSFSTEADTSRIASRLSSMGKRVYFPRVEGGEMVAVLWEGQAFVKNKFGIYEPEGEAFSGQPDVCVMPLLGVDKSFNRLGYGGGFYDRYLSDKDKIYKIGLCYDYQVVEDIVHEEHDIPLDAIVTDERIMLRRVN